MDLVLATGAERALRNLLEHIVAADGLDDILFLAFLAVILVIVFASIVAMPGLGRGSVRRRCVVGDAVLIGGGVDFVGSPMRRVVGMRGVFRDLFLTGPLGLMIDLGGLDEFRRG
ncbi:hypothetical protein BraRD5C2_17430 [Bradyrhizobium sp. RD5-C2]|nr:hypothetical protein BraRD5C2_17430 [Bradyrhizobium sp. RD5-C2]